MYYNNYFYIIFHLLNQKIITRLFLCIKIAISEIILILSSFFLWYNVVILKQVMVPLYYTIDIIGFRMEQCELLKCLIRT